MPKKEPTCDDIERKARQIDALTAAYEQACPEQVHPSPNFYALTDEELAAASRPLSEIVAEARARATSEPGVANGGRPDLALAEGSDALSEDPFFQNEIQIESKPAPKPRRKRGQRTKEGQVIASRNSLKHGIMSNAPVVDDFETMEAWELHLAGISDSINPQGPLEESLAYRLAGVLWRLNRVPRHETASIKLDIAEVRRRWAENEEAKVHLGEPPGDPADLQAAIDFQALPNDETTGKVIKYETFLHRESLQLIHELEAFQARRNGERTPLARLDISAPPS